MTTVLIEGVDEVRTREIDENGRVYVGTALAGEEVKVVLETEEGTDE